MKILYIALLHSPHSQRWIQYFADKDNEVHAISFVDQTFPLENVKVHIIKPFKNITFNFFYAIPFILKVRKTIKSINPDIIHIHQIFSIYQFIFKNIGYPTIITPWGTDILVKPKNNPLISWNRKKIVKNSDFFICDAKHLKQELLKFGADEKNIKIIYFGTNVNDFNPKKRNPDFCKKLNFKEGTKLILSLRAFHPVYDIPTFIRAIPIILKEFPNIGFILVGSGPEKDNIIRLSKELNIFDKTRFLGRLPNKDLQITTASSDIYVSTSLSDGGLAASTAEAMASGVPVVISDFGENKEWVEEGVSGFLFPLRDHKKLAEKIIALLKDPALAEQIAKKGREVIEIRNNYLKEMEKVSEIYKEVYKNYKK